MSSEDLLKEYDSNYSSYKAFEILMQHLLSNLLDSKNLKVHNISTRVKERASLDKKVSSKNKYDKIEEITDIIGLRIITFFEDEVDIVSKIINEEFKVDPENSVDKRVTEYDKFGYSSVHYVVTIDEKRGELLEYNAYKTQKFEIQIRSLLQHAWAEIEHDIGYKSKTNIPDIVKRNFSRVAALLETSDLEFTKLRLRVTEYEKEVRQEITENPAKVDLNDISLESFIRNNDIVEEIDKLITEKTRIPFEKDDDYIDTSHIPKLMYLNVVNIDQLSNLLKERKEDIVKFAEIFNKGESLESGYFSEGISIFYLCYLLLAEKGNKKEINNFVHKYWNKNDDELGNEIIETYQELIK